MRDVSVDGWDLRDFENLGEWAEQLKTVPSSNMSVLRAVLRNLAAIIEERTATEPEPVEEEETTPTKKKRGDKGKEVVVDKEEGVIQVKRKQSVRGKDVIEPVVVATPGVVINDPGVRP